MSLIVIFDSREIYKIWCMISLWSKTLLADKNENINAEENYFVSPDNMLTDSGENRVVWVYIYCDLKLAELFHQYMLMCAKWKLEQPRKSFTFLTTNEHYGLIRANITNFWYPFSGNAVKCVSVTDVKAQHKHMGIGVTQRSKAGIVLLENKVQHYSDLNRIW